jgi:hypothetical protein
MREKVPIFADEGSCHGVCAPSRQTTHRMGGGPAAAADSGNPQPRSAGTQISRKSPGNAALSASCARSPYFSRSLTDVRSAKSLLTQRFAVPMQPRLGADVEWFRDS